MKNLHPILRRLLQSVIIVILFSSIYLGLAIAIAHFTYYNPNKTEVLSENKADTLFTDQTFSLLSWNIGYAGLGANMDFFYDGGKGVRDTKEITQKNFRAISQFLSEYEDSCQFMFLQEVDIRAKRSYRINQFESLLEKTNYNFCTQAINYNVKYIPMPILNPMGKVVAGIATFSHEIPKESVRYGFNKNFGFPTKLFMLNRCFLVCRYPTDEQKELVLINIHNSAFDNGDLKKDQLKVIRQFAISEFKKKNYVLIGGDWNQYPPNFKSQITNYKTEQVLNPINKDLFPDDWQWVYDNKSPTNRDVKYALPDTSQTIVIDYFLLSPNISHKNTQTIDLKFQHSDHNPVLLKFDLN